jgi:hypothetical protein
MSPARKLALLGGVFFIITFVASIAGLILYGPLLHHTDYIVGAGTDTRISMGAFCEIILCIANIGSAVVLFPVLKHQSEPIALGYVASRTVESTIIAVGIVSVLAVVTLRKDLAGVAGLDSGALVIAGRSLVAVHDWTFLLGPAVLAGLGNGLMLGYLMFKSGLVPRGMAMLGLIGGPLVLIAATATLFGVFDQTSTWSSVLTIPEFIWELSLGIYLTVKGFKDCPVLDEFERSLPKAQAA